MVLDIDPDYITSVSEIDRAISKIDKYEKEFGKKAVIALKQNRQLGGSYKVVSEERARTGKASNCEFYPAFWNRQYFEELKEKLQRESK